MLPENVGVARISLRGTRWTGKVLWSSRNDRIVLVRAPDLIRESSSGRLTFETL